MPITDSFGVWGNLGTITPNSENWQIFPLTALETNESIRATFMCSDFSKINSFGWLRMVFKVGGEQNVYPAQKIYPKPEKIIYRFPMPQDMMQRGITARSFEIKLGIYYRQWGVISSINWSIQLEELWG